MHEQVDRPSTLMTGWLNLYTPVGREHVGHNRVDHEKEEYARDGRRIAYASFGSLSVEAARTVPNQEQVLCGSLASTNPGKRSSLTGIGVSAGAVMGHPRHGGLRGRLSLPLA